MGKYPTMRLSFMVAFIVCLVSVPSEVLGDAHSIDARRARMVDSGKDEHQDDKWGKVRMYITPEYRATSPEDIMTARSQHPACVPGDFSSCNLRPVGAPPRDGADGLAGGPPAGLPNGEGACESVAPSTPTADLAAADLSAFSESLQINPRVRGLTGMDTWLWVEGAPSVVEWTQTGAEGVNAACELLAAPTVTFAAAVVGYEFEISGPDQTARYRSDRPGSEDNPAAVHVFERTGEYTVTLQAQMVGDVAATVPIDERSYEVIQVRSRLINPRQ